MNLGLCMVVKDEVKRIAGCLEPIIDLFDEVVIVDTGSTDGTPQLLHRLFSVEPWLIPLDEKRCGTLMDARNVAFERISTPWILLLDADERVEPSVLTSIRSLPNDPAVAGFFGRWVNHIEAEPLFEDYKLFLFRRGVAHGGLAHDNGQTDLRRRGLQAPWLDDLVVHHFPDPALRKTKAARYRQRLNCALRREPSNPRYHWFLGYMDFLEDQHALAIQSLARAAESRSRDFPVECLNSWLVLAEIHARRGETVFSARSLREALRFYWEVANDFEVRVNFRLLPWLERALEHCRQGRLEAIRAYRFAC